MPTTSAAFNSIAGFASNLQKIVDGMTTVANQIEPIFVCVAFLLLVFGTMRGFVQNDTRHFFGNLLRVIILVTLIGNWQAVTGIITGAVNAFCSLQITANYGLLTNNTNRPATARLDLAYLAAIIEQKVSASTGTTAPPVQSQGVQQPGSATQAQGFWQQVWKFFSNPIGQITQAGATAFQNQIITPTTHYLCLVLYAIFLIALLLCDLIVVLMEVLQNCILVFLGLYVPVGFAEFSIPSLRGQGEAFFKTYIGIQCWPVGWVFVNVVTIALFQNLAAPNPEDFGQVLIAIVYTVPVFLWVIIGHILAPFYIQKLVTRGGAEMQAFVGAMISAVGGTSSSVYGGAFSFGRWGAQKLSGLAHLKATGHGRMGNGYRRPENSDGRENSASEGDESGAENLVSSLPGIREVKGAETAAAGTVRNLAGGAVGLASFGLRKAWDTGEFGVRTAGSMANTLGALVADASSNRIGPERNFSFPRFPGNRPNRSSRRAANYLTYQDSQSKDWVES